jgi:hypothetical protein
MYKVIYCTKDVDGFIKEKMQTFNSFKEAVNFIRLITNTAKALGKPTIEKL